MSDAPKFKTFRDLKTIPKPVPKDDTRYTSISSIPSTTSISSSTSTPRKHKPENKKHSKGTQTNISEVAPIRDFQKVPNSVTRGAMAQGVFRGKSKQVWDYLWSVSRGAITPVRVIRKSRKEIKEGSGLGSMVTVDAAIEHLTLTGLLKVTRIVGSLNGNEYEIFTPEEASTYTSISSTPSITSPIQNLVHLDIPESSNTSRTQSIENTDSYTASKTLFKTLKYIDDEAPVINVLEKLNGAALKLTGKDITKKDLERLGDLVELLINETVIAAARTNSVSSTIAFMTELLRRRLYSKPRTTLGDSKSSERKDVRTNHLEVGKGTELAKEQDTLLTWTPQTLLTAEQRENTLSAFKKAKAENSVLYREFKTYGEIEYTPEDFEWLLENLEKEQD